MNELELFQSIKKNFDDIYYRDHDMFHYQIEYNLQDHTQLRFWLNRIIELWIWFTNRSNYQYDWWLDLVVKVTRDNLLKISKLEEE